MKPLENVWDYPRPPRLEPVQAELRVLDGEEILARTTRGYRVLETSHPPVYYFPPGDIANGRLDEAPGSSFCEWKGVASYFDVVCDDRRLSRMAWTYTEPTPEFAAIAGYVAFYATQLVCFVDDEQVSPQPGGFYGGWVTSNIVGPFKGGPGTAGW